MCGVWCVVCGVCGCLLALAETRHAKHNPRRVPGQGRATTQARASGLGPIGHRLGLGCPVTCPRPAKRQAILVHYLLGLYLRAPHQARFFYTSDPESAPHQSQKKKIVQRAVKKSRALPFWFLGQPAMAGHKAPGPQKPNNRGKWGSPLFTATQSCICRALGAWR